MDTAGGERHLKEEIQKDKRSWTALGVWDVLKAGGKTWLFLRHVYRKRLPFGELLSLLRSCHTSWNPARILIENAHFGPALHDMARGDLPTELISTATKNKQGQTGKPGKLERATELLIKLERGEVFLPEIENEWKPELESEWLDWTGHPDEQDDQVDMASYAAIHCRPQTQSWGGAVRARRGGVVSKRFAV